MSPQRIVAIVQARMSSRRLPGKVLLDICGKPMLAWVVERARRAHTLDEVIVATSNLEEDQAIIETCIARGYSYCQGSLEDVLARYYHCAHKWKADVIVRLTADCPIIDADLIDQTVQTFLDADPPVFYAANRLPFDRTYPIGLDVEVCSFEALEQAYRESTLKHEREHVMPYFYEPADRFPILLLRADEDNSDQRWTVDTEADLSLARVICEHFKERDDFSWQEVLEHVRHNPELKKLNLHVQQKGHLDVG